MGFPQGPELLLFRLLGRRHGVLLSSQLLRSPLTPTRPVSSLHRISHDLSRTHCTSLAPSHHARTQPHPHPHLAITLHRTLHILSRSLVSSTVIHFPSLLLDAPLLMLISYVLLLSRPCSTHLFFALDSHHDSTTGYGIRDLEGRETRRAADASQGGTRLGAAMRITYVLLGR